MKFFFISKADDNLDKIKKEYLIVSKREIICCTPPNSPEESFPYTLYKIKCSEDAFILKTTRRLDNNSVWSYENISELYESLKKEFTDETEPFVIAIHWGGKDHPENAKKLCSDRIEQFDNGIKDNCMLTHYSGYYDKGTIEQIGNNGTNINIMTDMIRERVNNEIYLDKANRLYELKEDLLRSLFPLILGQKLENEEIEKIGNVVESKNNKIGDTILEYLDENGNKILKSINDRISITLQSTTDQQVSTAEVYQKQLGDLREYLNELINEQLGKANKKSIYGN